MLHILYVYFGMIYANNSLKLKNQLPHHAIFESYNSDSNYYVCIISEASYIGIE